MPQFPFTGYHFGVYFLFPQFQFNAEFATVTGLGFSSGTEARNEGGIAGFTHSLTDRGSYNQLVLTRGLTTDMGLYEWCESTHNTLKTQPCNILISLLDKQSMPVKNWLLFHAIPKSWTGGGLDASSSSILMESVSFSYQNFILI